MMRIVARMDAVPADHDGPREEAGVLRQVSGRPEQVAEWIARVWRDRHPGAACLLPVEVAPWALRQAWSMIATALHGQWATWEFDDTQLDVWQPDFAAMRERAVDRDAGGTATAQAGAGPGLSNDNGGGAQVPALQDGEGARGCE